MEFPIRVAVRVKPDVEFHPPIPDRDAELGRWMCALEQRVSCVLGPAQDTQAVYRSTLQDQLHYLLDGCDTSLVLFTETDSLTPNGRTSYPHCDFGRDDEPEELISTYVRDVFSKLRVMPERNFVVHITWMRVANGGIVDLLGGGLVRCRDETEVLGHLSKARAVASDPNPRHAVFTMSIEQKWIDSGGILHHRLSTASFCELAAGPDPDSDALESVIRELIANGNVDYDRSLLTAMLKDSFGGRAYTWVLCRVDPELACSRRSSRLLELCVACRSVVNFVTVNGFADNDTPVRDRGPPRPPDGIFGLQFAAQQWIKLVSNAEALFQKIVLRESLSKDEIAQINEWLFLKAECDECLNPRVSARNCDDADEGEKRILPRITEDTEPSEMSDDPEADSDASVDDDDFLIADRLGKYIDFFTEKTDELFSDRCEEYLHCEDFVAKEKFETVVAEASNARRKTVRPGESLTGGELEILRRAAAEAISPESRRIISDSRKRSEDPESKLVQRELLKIVDSPVPDERLKKYNALLQKYSLKQNLIAKLSKEIEDGEGQLEVLTGLCSAEERLIEDLTKIIKRRSGMKHSSIRDEYENAKSELIAARARRVAGENDSKFNRQVERYGSIVDRYDKKMDEMDTIKKINIDNNRELKRHERKLKTCRKEIDQIKKMIKRNLKKRGTLEIELVKDKSKLDEFHGIESDNRVKEKKLHSFKHVNARISHLDNVLKEKALDLEKEEIAQDGECMLRREICNLRKTRECLIDERCVLRQKRKVYKSLSDTEERKMLECEEAIEAIDTAIECKNELLCGRVLLKDNARINREKGEEMLMQRLNKLSHNEMKTLLYRYFQKVIDLRSTCAGLEASTDAAQRDANGWRRRCADAWSALHHARLMHARRTTTLTARYYHTVNKLMREMAGDPESDNNSLLLAIPPADDTETTEYEQDNILTHHSRIAATKIKLKEENGKDNKILDRIIHGRNLERYTQISIPRQNLRQLKPICDSPITKVTREKNKLVIVQQEKTNK